MKEAVDCFNAKNYSESKRLFKNLLEQNITSVEKIEALTYLQNIYQLLHQSFPAHLVSLLFSLLDETETERIIDLYNQKNLDKNISVKLKYLEATYRIGKIEQSLTVAKDLCLDIVEKKYYSIAFKAFDEIENKFSGRLFYEFGRLIVSLEMDNYKTATEFVDKILNKLINKWPQVVGKKKDQDEYLAHTLSIVESFNVDEFNFRKNMLLWKMKISNMKPSFTLTNKEKMEAVVVFFESPEHYYLLINILKDEFIGYELLDYLKRNNVRDLHFYRKKKTFKTEKINSSNKEKIHTDYNIEKAEGEPTTNDIKEIYSKYKLSSKEDLKVDINDISLKDLKEAIISLVFVEEYKAALKLLEKVPDSSDKISLEVEILKKKEDYMGVSALCTELLSKGEGEDDLWLIENIIWGFEKSGKEVEAENFRSLLMGYNLTPHTLQRALLNEES